MKFHLLFSNMVIRAQLPFNLLPNVVTKIK